MADLKIIGRQPVLEALQAGMPIKKIYLKSGVKGETIQAIRIRSEEKNVPTTILTRQELERIAGTPGHQGVVAVMPKLRVLTLDQVLERCVHTTNPALALLDGVEDPRNFGAILRVADGTGLAGVVIPGRRTAKLTPAAIKASAGAAFHLPVAEVANLSRAMEKLKSHGFWLIGADMEGRQPPWEIDFRMPVGFVLGREGKGLHRLIREKCDFCVTIPMLGKIESLNVAAAAAMLFYERLRQLNAKP